MTHIYSESNINKNPTENVQDIYVPESQFIKLNFINNKKNSIARFKNTQNSDYYFFPSMLSISVHENKFNMSYDEIMNYISDQEIRFIIGTQTIFDLSIGFCSNYNGFIEENNCLLVPLDYKMFLKNVIFGAHNSIEIFINNDLSKNGLNLSFSLDIEIINTSSNTEKEFFFQHIQTLIVDNINNLTVRETIHHNHPTKGFFIGGDINSIDELKLILNGHDRFVYNDILLSTVCTKINDNFLYIPLDINEKYDDCSITSYLSSLNLSRIDSAIFEIKFNYIPTKIVFYTLSANLYKVSYGTPYIMFTN